MAPIRSDIDPTAPAPFTPQRKVPTKQGKAVKSLSDRVYKPQKPISRQEISRARSRKIEVLMFLIHHRVQHQQPTGVKQRPRIRESIANGLGYTTEITWDGKEILYRPPTFEEASHYWNIPKRTIKDWWAKRDTILVANPPKYHPRWPDLEDLLYGLFIDGRSKGKLITVGWFRRQAKKAFKELYPVSENLFIFSNGWFANFLTRNTIVRRRITKIATKLPVEYVKIANSFLQFIKRVSQPPTEIADYTQNKQLFSSPTRPSVQIRKYPKSRILNLDETPIPFEYLDGYTYNLKGEKTVGGKADRSGWNKRQATLILYIWGDGKERIRPKLIFHGKSGPTGQILDKERSQYSPDVTVEINETAYNNEALFLTFLNDELLPEFDGNSGLLVMDVATFHYTQAVRDLLAKNNVIPAMIPAGCTCFLQPLDTAINKPFKQWLKEAVDEYIEAREAAGGLFEKWSVSDKRIMTTWVVATAAKRLRDHNMEMIQQAFVQCGITIHPDGSQDDWIKLKDIHPDEIDFTGWENAYEAIVAQENYTEIPPALDEVDEFVTLAEDFDLLHITSDYGNEAIRTLRDMARDRNLKVSGRKVDLIQRLEQADVEDSKKDTISTARQ